MTTVNEKKTVPAQPKNDTIEGVVVEETPTGMDQDKKREIIKIAAIVGTTVAFHVACALVIRKLNRTASTPSITVE